MLTLKKRELLNLGTLPTFKMHNIGTVPTFKMHNKGTVPTFKMHNVGTVPTFKMHNIGTPIFLWFIFGAYIWIEWQNKMTARCIYSFIRVLQNPLAKPTNPAKSSLNQVRALLDV